MDNECDNKKSSMWKRLDEKFLKNRNEKSELQYKIYKGRFESTHFSNIILTYIHTYIKRKIYS